MGAPAFAYLCAPERRAEYVASPNLLITVLDLLAGAPKAGDFPGLYPFLLSWLDPLACPPAVPGSDWPAEVRLRVFRAMLAHPQPPAAPLCEAELDREQGAHDLRALAVELLLRLDRVAALNRFWRTLPLAPEPQQPDLRIAILQWLNHLATGDKRAVVEELEPLLEEALRSPRLVDRFNAMGVLLRLGRPDMREALRRFFEEHREDEPVAWSALMHLASLSPDEYVHEACRERVGNPDGEVGFFTAVRLLVKWWPEEIQERLLAWMRDGTVDPYLALPALLRHDRAAVVDWLREEVRTDDLQRLTRALQFVAGERVTELGPALLDRVRQLPPAARPQLYGALVALRTSGVEALLLAELASPLPPELRAAAAVELLNLGDAEGVGRVADLVAAADPAAIAAVLGRARQGGPRGVPDRLVPALLDGLVRIPGEDGKRAVLFVLRFRGRFDDRTRGALLEAYRREPSRRLAQEIAKVIEELAHR
jgi:hypothetical protein